MEYVKELADCVGVVCVVEKVVGVGAFRYVIATEPLVRVVAIELTAEVATEYEPPPPPPPQFELPPEPPPPL
jgi:hypothetical protein